MNNSANNATPRNSTSVNEDDPSPLECAREKSTVALPASPPAPSRAPLTLGKYTILEEGWGGGMGVVYKARDTELDRIVALKLIKGGVLATDEELVRFRREARAAARFNHPNIIPIHETGEERGCPYFIMAFACGGSLAQHRDRFAEPRAAAALLETIARAVHYGHQHGVLHRDLKPANILFGEGGTPWVSDFGLAKLVDGSLDLTQPGQLLGTPSYMAPEQASGQTDRISAQTDVWALGVILYELLTGQRPFKAESQEEQLRKVRSVEPPTPRSLKRTLDRALETVILKCLEKDPARRYASAEALADDLARWQRGEPVLARPPFWTTRAGRSLRRYRTFTLRAVFAVVLFVLLALAWKGISPTRVEVSPGDEPEDPQQLRAMEDQLARLEKGETVSLLGESGPPLGARWQPRRTEARFMLDMEQVFRIYAGKQPGLLELLPTSPKRFRLRAQVQHTDSRPLGRVGLYFAHGVHRTEEGRTHCFFKLAFNDRYPLMGRQGERGDPQSQVSLTLPVYQEKKGAVFFHHLDTTCALSRLFTPAGESNAMPWRNLEVEVTPQSLKVFWEKKQIILSNGAKAVDQCDPTKPLQLACTLMGLAVAPRNREKGAEPLGTDGELVLGGGLGLYVEQGVAAFRSVAIEPLSSR